jgi:hypothetical protein
MICSHGLGDPPALSIPTLSIIGLRKSGNPPPPKAEVDYQGVVALTHTATSVTNVWFFHVLVSRITYCCKFLMCLQDNVSIILLLQEFEMNLMRIEYSKAI